MNPHDINTPRTLPAEAPEPAAGNATVPIWLMLALGALFYWGELSLDSGAGGFNKLVYSPYFSEREVKMANPQPKLDPLYEKGQGTFMLYCAACHQNDGMGSSTQAPPLVGSDWVLHETPDRIIRLVLFGLQGPVKVSGKEYNFTTAMPPWKDVLNDEQIAAVLTFIRQNRDWNHNASSVKPEKVAEIRKAEAGRAESWTAEQLLKIP
jgi:mono/diheme cytochrome c family protein